MTMLEKMARALCEAGAAGYGAAVGPDLWDKWADDEHKAHFRRQARAALLAIREVSEGVGEAGWFNGEHTLEGMGPDYPSYVESCQSIFTAMIDAILAEKPE